MSFPLSNFIIYNPVLLLISSTYRAYSSSDKVKSCNLHDLNNYEENRNEIKVNFLGCTLLKGLIDVLVFCVEFFNELWFPLKSNKFIWRMHFFKNGHPHMMETMAFFVKVPASGLLHLLMFNIVSVLRNLFCRVLSDCPMYWSLHLEQVIQ